MVQASAFLSTENLSVLDLTPKPRKESTVSELTDGASTVASLSGGESNLMANHLFTRLKAKLGDNSTLVFGHRGGYFGEENTMKGFRGAIEHKLDGIEFDVSFTIQRLTFYAFLGLAQQRRYSNDYARGRRWLAIPLWTSKRQSVRMDPTRTPK